MKRFGMAACALSLTAIARAQAPQPVPTFKAGVELVRLDVQITDANGLPLRDVKADELEVFESGVRRPIIYFQHVEEPSDTYSDITRRTVSGDVSTNQRAARGHLYVFVFDQQHIAAGNEQRARIAAERFVRARLRPSDRAAVYLLPGPGLSSPFTSDADRIVGALRSMSGVAQAVENVPTGTMTLQEAYQIARGDQLTLQKVNDRVRAEGYAPLDVSGRTQESDTVLNETIREEARTLTRTADGESRRVLALLRDILQPMRAIEGRKTVLFFSEGFNGDNLTRELDDVASAAAQSYSVISAVDLSRRGLDASSEQPTTTDRSIGIHDNMTPLGGLATATSGQLILDAYDRLDPALASIADQSQDYYVIGFSPRDESLKNRDVYRPVEVRLHRGGTRVSARTGVSLAERSATLTRRDAIDRALAAPFAQQGLPVRYTTYVLRGSAPGLQRVIVSLESDLPLASVKSAAADVVFVVRSAPDGRVVASGTDRIALPERREAGATTGTGAFHVQFELPAGSYIMRAAVREPGGLVGTADRRFVVAALDGPSIAAGDLILGGKGADLPVRPTARSGEALSGMIDVYARTPEQLRGARVDADLTPLGDETALVAVHGDLAAPRTLSGGVASLAHIDLPLEGVPAGMYLARASIKVGSDTIAELAREVEVRAGHDAADAPQSEAIDGHEIAAGSLAREFAASLDRSAPGAAESIAGLARLDHSDYPGAVAAFTRSLELEPSRAPVAFLLGWAYHGAGDDRQAISAWRRAAFIDPKLLPAHLALADIYVQLSQRPLAIQALRAGLAVLPQSIELHDRLTRLEQR